MKPFSLCVLYEKEGGKKLKVYLNASVSSTLMREIISEKMTDTLRLWEA